MFDTPVLRGADVVERVAPPRLRPIILVDSVLLTREGLAAMLRGRGLTVDACGDDLDALQHFVQRAHSSVVVVVNASTTDVDACVASVRSVGERCIVAVGVPERVDGVVRCAELKLAGFTLADGSIDELVDLIDTADHNRAQCPSAAVPILLGAIARGHTVSTLTGRENDIVELLREGLSNKEIASRLGISSRTVKNQLHHLYEKRGVHSRGELIAQMWSQT